MRLFVFILFVFGLCSQVSATTFYWETVNGITAGSPSGACQAARNWYWQISYVNSGEAAYYNNLEPILRRDSEAVYFCAFRVSFKPEPVPYTVQEFRVSRKGDSCEEGATYDPATGVCKGLSPDRGLVCEAGGGLNGMDKVYNSDGQCVSLEQVDTPATCKYLAGKGTVSTRIFVTFDDDGQPNQVPVNRLGCVANPITLANCKQPVAIAKDGISIQHGGSNCTVDVSFTGEPFETGATSPYPMGDPAKGEQGMCEKADCVVPDAPTVTDSKPCNYMSNGQVVGCETTQFQGNPGEMNCGTVNGGPYTCTSRPATSKGTSVKTEIKTTANSDGSQAVTKDDTHTEVKCIAPGSCTTTVTKTTNVTIKNGAGETTSSTTTCTGSKCASSTNPDADGDGLGDCVKDCSEEEDGTFNGPDITEAKTVQESTQAFMSSVKGSPLMTSLSSISVPSGGSCHFGSANLGFTEVNFDVMCDLWSDISGVLGAVFLAGWALLAVLIVMRA